MLNSIFLIYFANKEISQEVIQRRLHKIKDIFHFSDENSFSVYQFHDLRAGILCILPKQTVIDIPTVYQTPSTIACTAYFPFGVTSYVTSEQLHSGTYIQHTIEHLKKNPESIRQLAPPQVWFALDADKHQLDIFNDFRGFGRIYECKSDFGTVWTNKMSAATLLAGEPAAVNKAAWAQMVTLGMFTGQHVGRHNMELLPAETHIHINMASGYVSKQRLPQQDYSALSQIPASAVDETCHAMLQWHKELVRFSSAPRTLSLSGGRDSRVIAAYAFATNLENLTCKTSYPPQNDYTLAKQLVENSHKNFTFIGENRREIIINSFALKMSLLEHASGIIHNFNEDISAISYLSNGTMDNSADTLRIHLAGCQGEVAHANFYTNNLIEREKLWFEKGAKGTNPVEARIQAFYKQLFEKVLGISSYAKNVSNNSLMNIVDEGFSANIKGLYILDYLYLHVWLNRQWAGAESIDAFKTPLTLYPYVYYGFRQSIDEKLRSKFIRNIIEAIMPQWKNIPFFHELPPDENNDFYIAYPTYWDVNRGDEITEIALSHKFLWEYFDKASVLETFLQFKDKTFKDDERKGREWNRVAQKLLWTVAFYKHVDEINKAIKSL